MDDETWQQIQMATANLNDELRSGAFSMYYYFLREILFELLRQYPTQVSYSLGMNTVWKVWRIDNE